MEFIKRVLKRLLFNFYLLQKTQWVKFIKLYDSKSNNILFLFPSFPKNSFSYLFSGVFENDFALLNALIDNNLKFKIIVGHKSLGLISKKTIYFNISNLFTFHEGNNYAESMLNFLKKINEKNEIVPNLENCKYWENKIYMHDKFQELNISHPFTFTIANGKSAPLVSNLKFPLLLKLAHGSGSIGIVKIENEFDYKKEVEKHKDQDYLIQNWIDMRSDLRLIYIGEELVLHYWRINEGKEWKPTSTGHGSSVDFETLPTKWMDFIFKEYKKLNLKAGAFDITWEKDDLDTIPLILEVSPSFMPNPAPIGIFINKPYKDFKKSIWGKHAYHKQYINLVFDFKSRLIFEYLKEKNGK